MVFNTLFRNKIPNTPEITEPIRIAIFDELTNATSSKANNVMNIDMVKPIPAKNPTPKILLHYMSEGNFASFSFTPMYDMIIIPNGFPITSPAIIPKLPT